MGQAQKKLERMFDRREFRHVLPNFWLVAREYAIVPEGPGSTLSMIVVREAHPTELYVPFQKHDLMTSFVRLAARGYPSEGSVLGWVSDHGLLRRAEANARKGKRNYEHQSLAPGEPDQAPELLEDFVAEVLRARSVLNLYADISAGGVDELRKRIGDLRDKHERGEPLSDLDYELVERWGGQADKVGRDDDGLGIWASARLGAALDNRLENVRPALWSDFGLHSRFDRYRPTPSWECPDLISAIYLQLYLWITEGLPMRRCIIPTCGTPFPITRGDKKVCGVSCRSNLRHYPELQRRR